MIVDRALEVIRDRSHRQRMADADYWDERVQSRDGDARSVWHSASFNHAWNHRQMQVLESAFRQLLGDIRGQELLDVGCGTGRITLELQRMGARAVGVDFSSAAVQAASKESVAKEPPIRFMVGDIARPPLPFDNESFDATVAVGCLAVACKDLASLEQALRELARLTKKSGAIVLLEPIHSSRLLGRVLRASVADWLQAADRAGLQLVARRGMGFIPIRLAMSSFDLPRWMVKPVFRAGENALESLPLQRLADYSLLGFRHAYR